MADIEDATALSAVKDWSAAVGTYWNYFSVVSLGAVGFAVSMREQKLDEFARAAVVAAFLLFASGNHTALLRSQRTFVALAHAMRKRARRGLVRPKEYALVFRETVPYSVSRVRRFHIAVSVVVAGVIWIASAPAQH